MYSVTALQSYAICPFYFKAKHIDRVKVEDAENLVKGRLVHDILRYYTLACYNAKQPNLFDKWEQIALDTIRKHSVLPEYEDDILATVKEYIEGNEIEIEGLAGVEEKLAIDANLKQCKWDKGWFRMKIDKLYLFDTMCKVVDYKAGFDMTPDRFQIETYFWVLSKIYPNIENFQGVYDFIRFGWHKTFDMTRDDLARIEAKVLNRIRQVEEDKEYKPKVSNYCSMCAIYRSCPVAKQAQVERMPTVEGEAVKLLEAIVVKDRGLKDMKALLKGWIAENGTLIHRDVKAEIKAITSYDWDISKLMDHANTNNIALIEALSVDSKKISKLLGEPLEVIGAGFGEKKLSTRFQVVKNVVKKDKK